MSTKAGAAEWVRAPRQARSQQTLERFLDATHRLLETRRFEDITVADIVREADRTVGSFYARFDDKYAVLYEIVEHAFARIRDVARAFCDPVRWEGQPIEDWVDEAVRLDVLAYRRTGALFRAALCAATIDDRFRLLRIEMMQFCAQQQKRLVVSRAAELQCADPARASDLMFELVTASLDHELLFGRFTVTSPVSDRELVDELTGRCRTVLGLPAELASGVAPV